MTDACQSRVEMSMPDREVLARAFGLIAGKRFADAIGLLSNTGDQIATSAAGLTLLAAGHRGLGHSYEAKRYALRAACLEPAIPAPQAELARAVIAGQQPNTEISTETKHRAAKRAVVLQPGQPEFWAYLSTHPPLLSAKGIGNRRAALMRWLLLTPGAHAAWATKGLVEGERTNPAAGLPLLKRAALIQPNDTGLQIALADSAFDGLRGDVFVRAAKRAQVLSPGDPDALMLTVQEERLHHLERTSEAERRALRKLDYLLKSEPERLLRTCRRIDVRTPSAPVVAMLREAARRASLNPRLWRRLGELQGGLEILQGAEAGQGSLATHAIKRALIIDPAEPYAYLRLLRSMPRNQPSERVRLSAWMTCCEPDDVRLMVDRIVLLGAASDVSRLRAIGSGSARRSLPASVRRTANGVAAFVEGDLESATDLLAGIHDVASWGSHRGAGAFLPARRLASLSADDAVYDAQWTVGNSPPAAAGTSDGPRFIVSVSANKPYVDFYLRDFLASVAEHVPHAHVHLSAVNMQPGDLDAAPAGGAPSRLSVSGLGIDREEPLFASMARFLAVPHLLETTGLPVLVVDVDCRFAQPLDTLEDLVEEADIGLDDPPDWAPWSRYPGGFVVFRPTPAGIAFARLMAAIQTTLHREKPFWGGDQTALLSAVWLANRQLPELRIAGLGDKGIWDIVSISSRRNILLRYGARSHAWRASMQPDSTNGKAIGISGAGSDG